MRLARLGLDRYGHFTDRVLEFDPNARVTIVLGANEAGKSTALKAVVDALFGIEPQSRFDFLHGYKGMRLSADVVSADGRSLSFARLKRRTAPLVDPVTDQPLNDDCLAPFLGAHDRKAFLEIFGLDQERLRAGGRSLLAGGGDLADVLLSAAPGLADVAALRDRLQASAATIFNPDRRSATHALYRAIDRRAQAQKRLRELEVRVEEVKRVREQAEQADTARGAAVRAEIDAGLACTHAQALVGAVKELRLIDAGVAERETLGDLPSVEPGFIAQARAVLAEISRQSPLLDMARAEAEAAEAALNAIGLDDGILPFAEEIEQCDGQRTAVQGELKSLPKRRDEVTEARSALMRVASGLGLADIEALRALSPGPPALARADRAADRLAAIEVRSEGFEAERRTLAGRRAEIAQARAALGHVIDPALTRRRLAALDGVEAREHALKALGHRQALVRAELSERLVRLNLGVADVEALAAIALPMLAAAEAGLRRVLETTDAQARSQEARIQAIQQLAQAEARLNALNAGRPAPTQAAIAAARRERDDAWDALKPIALGHRGRTEEDAALAHGLDRAIGEADRLADERLTETKRLADLAAAERTVADLKAAAEGALAHAEAAGRRCDDALGAWNGLWAVSGLAMKADETAIAVLREADAILRGRGTLLKEAADAEGQRDAARWDRLEYEQLRADLGLPARGDAPVHIADIRSAISELEHRFQQARDCDRDLRTLDQGEAEFAGRADAIAAERLALASEVAAVFPPLAIRPEAPVEEAKAALGLWREALTIDERLRTAERRASGIVRDEQAFTAAVHDLVGRAGVSLQDDPFDAARRLRGRLDAARQARAKADAAVDALSKRHAALAAAQAALDRSHSGLAALVAPLPPVCRAALEPFLDRLERAAGIEGRIDQARARLAHIRGSRGEEEIRADLANMDDDTLARRVAEAEAVAQAARLARDLAVERDTQARTALEAMEARDGAAVAAQEEQDALSEIADAADRFTRNHVAARLLGIAIERYRQAHQNPIVERASRAFATLTCGRWEGIGVDYDEDPPKLAALRDGRLLGIGALSEGTADQLFLALRVAAIESHATRATPLPFIADDLFVSFDEARTEAGMTLLAELGATTQVIVFTHHAHVADCGVRALGDAAAVLRL